MDDLLSEFLTETRESIDVVDVELVKLEQDPNNSDVIDNIFRLVHTIKGTCGFLGLPRLESVAHSSENVLGRFRDKELEVTPGAVTVVLASLDRIKDILSELETSGQEPEGDDNELIAKLDVIYKGESPDAAAAAETQPESGGATPESQSTGEAALDPALGRTLKPGEVSLDELERAFHEADGPDSGMTAANDTNGHGGARGRQRLYERVGGEDTVSVMAHLLAKRSASDTVLAPFVEDISEEARKARFIGLLTALFKDDDSAAGNVMALFVTRPGFGDDQFNALTALARDVFKEVQLDNDSCDDACMTLELVRAAALAASKKAAAPAAGAATATAGKKAAQDSGMAAERRSSQSIRVSVDLLEDLMNMVSELVLTRNQLQQMLREDEDSEYAVPIQRLSQTTTELQEGVMKTRMQPIGNAWAKLPRIVRDLSVDLEKKVELDMQGAETELDRQVLELIKDPLTHMVRNSADHGIETPAERVAMGKPETGRIHLNAYHEGGHIIVSISDDGRGIPVEKLKKKILDKGLASAGEIAGMSDSQIQKYIFHPGFSTAEQVTNVSGRGVGMDVVRSNIEKIGGTVDMVSTEGKGSTFQIKIPLTLAIVSALIVQSGGERFAIPQISVLELVRAGSSSEYMIEKIKDTPVLRLRNRLLPLVHLNEILGFATQTDNDAREIADDFIVVAQVGTFTFGIVVDAVYDTEEIVVKPVAPILKHLPIYSGNTILGDGSVIMILDPNGIAEMTNGVIADEEEEAVEAAAATAEEEDKETLLLFRAGADGRKAVPLALIARLEDIEIDRIEKSNGQHVVQYRGKLMPLVLAEGCEGFRAEGRQPVLVFADGDHSMGLVVDEILDIVEDRVEITLSSDKPGRVGSAIVAEKATDMIDVAWYLNQAFGEWLQSRDQNSAIAPSRDTRVLLVDDSSFFRNMLKPLLAVAGYRVTSVDGAQEALDLREAGEDFDLIVSDIDMPGMDGFELAKILKTGGRWADVPLVALSSHSSEKHIEKGRKVGFNDYIAKFDRKALLESLSQQLKIQGDAA